MMSGHEHPATPDRPSPGAAAAGPGEGREIRIGQLRLMVKEDGSRTRGTLAIGEFAAEGAFQSPPPHLHREHEEGFYVLEGELEFTVGDRKLHAPAGTFVMVPIGVPHTFANPHEAPVRFLVTFTPDFYLRYFEEVAPLFASGRPDPAAVGRIMARYATEAVLTK
jgi:mannose-6-phosphate isomerase-like protein (cupin superfamily)